MKDARENGLPEGPDGPPSRPPRRVEDGRGPDETPLTRPQHDRRLDADRRMLESLVCPVTQTPLDFDRDAQELISRRAALAYPIRDGIPILLVAEARRIDD